MAPSKSGRCCQSSPRCKACPVWRSVDLLALAELGEGHADLPAHLRGIPECLHKYEPLLRSSRQGDMPAGDEPVSPAAA